MSNLVVLEALTRACSQNVNEVKVAETQLKDWETKPGFYLTLLRVVNDHSLDTGARWMAAVTLKKGVDRYWRKTAPNAISEEEKKELRDGLLNTFFEPVNQVAVQIAVIIAKAARFDSPHEWPTLVPALIDVVIKGENPGVQNRALLVLHHVIKTLSAKRLTHDRRVFHELTVQVYSFMLNFHNSTFESFFVQVQNKNPQCQATLGNALLSIKIMRNLTIHGFNELKSSPEAVQYVSSVFDRIKTMLHIRKTLEGNCEMKDLFENVIIKLTKTLLALLESYPLSFVPFIHPSLSLTVALLFTPEGDGLLFERFIIYCFKLIQGIIMCLEYRFAKPPVDEGPMVTPSEAVQAYRIRNEFFRDDVVANICMKIVTHYMKLQQKELELWDSDPEEFINSNSGELNMRPCVESLFVALFRTKRDPLAPILIQLVQANYHPVPPHDLDAVLTKDAVYTAVGLAAFDLYDEIDMDKWFEMLQQEMNIREGHYRIIRRRAAWLLGQWSDIRFSQHLRPVLYRSFIPLLQKNEDFVVRWTTANAIKQAIDDFMFNVEEFMEFTETYMILLFDLLKDCQEDDTMIHTIWVISFVIERVGAAIQPYSTALFHHIPVMWERSQDHNMLRTAVLNIVLAFAKVLVMDEMFPFFYKILDDSINLDQESHCYLLEDGLDVWLAILENTGTMNSPLFELLKRMPPILEEFTDNFKICCEILQLYIVLAPKEVLSGFGDQMFSCLYDQINDLKVEGVAEIYQVVERAMTVDPESSIPKAMPIISEAFITIYSGSSSPIMVSTVLTIASRIVLQSPEIFGQIVENVSQSKGVGAEVFLDQMLSTWTYRMGIVTNMEKRKLLALALASLLTVNSPTIMNRFTVILDNIMEAFFDVVEVTDDTLVDSLLMSRLDGSAEETTSERRIREICKNDMIYNIHLAQFLKSKMDELATRLEPHIVEQIMASVSSPETLEGLRLTQNSKFLPVLK